MSHWEILDQESLSDYQYTSFGLMGVTPPSCRKLTINGLSKLFELINYDLWLTSNSFSEPTPETIHSWTHYIINFTNESKSAEEM